MEERKLDTQEEIEKISRLLLEVANLNGLDIKEDEWSIIQPYKNGQIISISVSNEEKRTMKVKIKDKTFILDTIDEELDIFL